MRLLRVLDVRLLVALAASAACAPAPEAPATARLQITDVLGGVWGADLERALEPREFSFPADHGPHPTFASEWWYLTGNLQTAAGRPFGYQITFFRISLGAAPSSGINDSAPGTSDSAPSTDDSARGIDDSAWATNQVWMVHFAVADIGPGRFFAFDRFQRGALGLAGATASPWRVWLDDWSLEQEGSESFPLRLRAHERLEAGGDAGDEVAVDLLVSPLKDMVLPGDRGLSQKGPTPGNASFYYSFTRLQTSGTVRVGNQRFAVEGTSWLDREWSTSALPDGQVGWDWFGLQLSDGTELLFYQLREADGSPSAHSGGTLVLADGSGSRLDAADVELTVERSWISPIDGTVYPSGWRLSIPARGVELRIEPLIENQELDLTFRYWEGAVSVAGAGLDGTPVSGRGYVELTGYAEGGQAPLIRR